MVPSESTDDEPENDTVRGIVPEGGVALATAVGAMFAALVTVTVAVSVAPLSSVTVRVAVWLPAVV